MKKFAVLMAVLAAFLYALPVGAQTLNDHLTCHKVRDTVEIGAKLNLFPVADPPFTAKGCEMKKAKAKLLCVPTEKVVASFTLDGVPADPISFDGQELTDMRLCYKVKCPKEKVENLDVIDQFAARQLKIVKNVKWLCTPAALPGFP